MKDDFFAALANSYRREIIRLLKKKSMSAGEIAEHFDISKPSISRHLEQLKNAELVVSKRKGNQIIYSLNMSVMQEVGMELIELFSAKEGDLSWKTER